MGQLNMDIYIKKLQKRYVDAYRKENSLILNVFCVTSGYHRLHAIRMLAAEPYKTLETLIVYTISVTISSILQLVVF